MLLDCVNKRNNIKYESVKIQPTRGQELSLLVHLEGTRRNRDFLGGGIPSIANGVISIQ